MPHTQNVKTYIHEALPLLYPGILINEHYLFVMNAATDEPEIRNWTWPQPLDEQDLSDKCDEVAVAALRARVNLERARRWRLPVTAYLENGARAISVDMDGDGRDNITGLGATATALVQDGITDPITFTDADDIDQVMTPAEIKSVALQVSAKVQFIHGKARALKAMDPIPEDLEDDAYWT